MSQVPENAKAIIQPERCDAVVVGAGFAGLYAHYRLRNLGLTVRGFETAAEVGGTWHWNRYPGARVDSPSLQYSFSFSAELQQEWSWPEYYSPQPDLEGYLNHVADRFDLRRDIEFETTVTAATFDRSTLRWTVETSRGERVSARFLISAVGCLSATNVPDFFGIDSFEGSSYHTSRWPADGVDLRGKRVGIVGTGSSGIQAIPMLAEQAEQLFVFQRTPSFSLPANNHPLDPAFEAEWKDNYAEHRRVARYSRTGADVKTFPDRSALSVPIEERNAILEAAWDSGNPGALLTCFNDILTDLEANDVIAEFVRGKIREKVNDPCVADMLAPKDYPIGSKRICLDSGYYETFNRANVTLVDVHKDPIEEITPSGVRTASGDFDLDVLVFATGFDAFTGPLLRLGIVGENGLALSQKWAEGPRTYLGIATAGFPNLFIVTGPGSPSVLSNMPTSIEQHVDWITDAIAYMDEHGYELFEATAAAEDEWTTHVSEIANKTLLPRANSWFLGANIPGKPRVVLPYVGGVGSYRRKCDEVASAGYSGFQLTPASHPVVTGRR